MTQERGFGRIYRRTKNGVGYGAYVIAYSWRGRDYRESTGSLDRNVARRLLKTRLAEMQQGRLAGPAAERVTVDELLADLVVDYRIHGRPSLRTLTGHQTALLAHLGGVRAVDVTMARSEVRRGFQAMIDTCAAPRRTCRSSSVAEHRREQARGFQVDAQRLGHRHRNAEPTGDVVDH
jgi:hypothetical protein